MQLDFKFRNSTFSNELQEYVQERVYRLERFERKPTKMEVSFSLQKQTCRVDIAVRGKALELHSHHESESFFDCVDEAIEKMCRQMERKKDARAHRRRQRPSAAEADAETSFHLPRSKVS